MPRKSQNSSAVILRAPDAAPLMLAMQGVGRFRFAHHLVGDLRARFDCAWRPSIDRWLNHSPLRSWFGLLALRRYAFPHIASRYTFTCDSRVFSRFVLPLIVFGLASGPAWWHPPSLKHLRNTSPTSLARLSDPEAIGTYLGDQRTRAFRSRSSGRIGWKGKRPVSSQLEGRHAAYYNSV